MSIPTKSTSAPKIKKMDSLRSFTYEEQRAIVMDPTFIRAMIQLQEATTSKTLMTAVQRLNMTVLGLGQDVRASQQLNFYGGGYSIASYENEEGGLRLKKTSSVGRKSKVSTTRGPVFSEEAPILTAAVRSRHH